MSKARWQVPITLVFIFMGILLSLQFQAQSRFASDLSLQRTENLIAMVRGLSDKRQKLAMELYDLNKQLRAQTESDRDEKLLIDSLHDELGKLNIVTGTTALQGPGLTLTIEQHMPILYIDIINLVNELWAAGAEAIAINNQRITAYSSIFYYEDEAGMLITINNRRLAFPLVITALGDANNLEKGLTIPGGIMDTLALFKAYPALEKANKLTVPPVHTPSMFFFLQEYKPPADTPPTTQPVTPTGPEENEKHPT